MTGPERSSEQSATRLVRNTLINVIGGGAGILATLLVTPFMVDEMGTELYGVWILALTLTFSSGYLALTDLGVQYAAVRAIAEARGSGDAALANRFYSASFALFVAVALVVGPLAALAAPLLVEVFSVPDAYESEARAAFAIIAAQVVCDLPSMAFRAALEGAQRYALMRFLDVARSVGIAVSIVIALEADGGLVSLALLSFGWAALTAFCLWLGVRINLPELRLRLREVRRDEVRNLLTFGGSLFLLRIVSIAYRQMDKALLAIFIGVAAVTQFEIASKIQAALILLLTTLTSALLPAAAYSSRDRPRLRELYLRGSTYSVALTVPVAIGVAFAAEDLVVGWVDEAEPEAVVGLQVFMIWIAMSALDTVGWTIVVAMGERIRQIVLLNLGWLALNFVLSLAFVEPFGVVGVIAATSGSYALLSLAYLRLWLDEFNLNLGEWARRVLVPVLPAAVIQLPVMIAIGPLVDPLPELLRGMVVVAVGVLAAVLVTVRFGLPTAERASLLNILGRATGLARVRPS